MNKALFLDRDGVVNLDKGYVYLYEDIVWFEEIFEIIKMANERDYKVIILTNQSGIARGKYKEEDVELLHEQMLKFLGAKGLNITDIFYCAQMEGDFRKPAPGMLFEAQKKYNIDLSKSFMVGDKVSDIFETPKEADRPTTFLIKGNYSFDNLESLERVEIYNNHQELLNKLKVSLK